MIEEIVIMGGAYSATKYGSGNETPVAEFNVYSDPEAAKIVFEADVPVKAVGLDVTMNPRKRPHVLSYFLFGHSRSSLADVWDSWSRQRPLL